MLKARGQVRASEEDSGPSEELARLRAENTVLQKTLQEGGRGYGSVAMEYVGGAMGVGLWMLCACVVLCLYVPPVPAHHGNEGAEGGAAGVTE